MNRIRVTGWSMNTPIHNDMKTIMRWPIQQHRGKCSHYIKCLDKIFLQNCCSLHAQLHAYIVVYCTFNSLSYYRIATTLDNLIQCEWSGAVFHVPLKKKMQRKPLRRGEKTQNLMILRMANGYCGTFSAVIPNEFLSKMITRNVMCVYRRQVTEYTEVLSNSWFFNSFISKYYEKLFSFISQTLPPPPRNE